MATLSAAFNTMNGALSRAVSLPASFGVKTAGSPSIGSATGLQPDFAQVLLLQSLTHGAGLVGKNVLYASTGSSQLKKGPVTSVTVENGNVSLLVNGNKIALSQVRAIVA